MLAIVINALKTFHVSMEKNKIYKLLIIGLISMVICSTAFFFLERHANEGLTYSDALWWGFVTCTTVGYGDYFPVTPGGRMIGILLMLVGISTFGFVTAAIASVLVDNALKEGMGLMKIDFDNHIIIIGWNNKSKIILDELMQDNPDNKVVIIDTREKLNLDYKNAYFVHGDPTEDNVLKKANVSKAHTCIVVADGTLETDNMADSKSVLICLAVDELNENIHLIAEILNEKNLSHFKRANVNDFIISNQMSSRVMVRSALYKNVSHTLKELLTNEYGNEIYESPVHKEYIGMKFKDLACKYIEEHNVIILGIANDGILVNPDKDKIIEENDILIYISKEKL